jgi:hypothetical protein
MCMCVRVLGQCPPPVNEGEVVWEGHMLRDRPLAQQILRGSRGMQAAAAGLNVLRHHPRRTGRSRAFHPLAPGALHPYPS